jgi:GNAT superfamily N-acetyltransferase
VAALTELRAMREADIEAVDALKNVTFADLERRLDEEPHTPLPSARSQVRLRHLLRTDPGGCWVAERDGALVGCALALVREGVWGLSLLVVHPDAQSDGLGRTLLRRAHDYGAEAGAQGWIVLASPDPRALRVYTRLGLTPHPCLRAVGVPNGVQAPSGVRDGTLDDLPLTVEVDRRVRRAAHGDDIAAMFEAGMTMLVAPGRGYAFVNPGEVRLLAATDEAAARDLLLAVLARAGDEKIEVDWLTTGQDWAVPTCLDAGLDLCPGSAVFLAGDVGPFRPYIPSGAYL